MTLSTVLKHAAESAFRKGMDQTGVRFAEWAAVVRTMEGKVSELEAEIATLRTKVAVLSEEG